MNGNGLRSVLRTLKKDFAMKFVVRDYDATCATLIVLDRGTFDIRRELFLSMGPESVDCDVDGAVIVFTWHGVRVTLYNRRDCG